MRVPSSSASISREYPTTSAARLSETEFTVESLEGVNQSLRAPERFWSDNLAFPGRYLDDYAGTTAA